MTSQILRHSEEHWLGEFSLHLTSSSDRVFNNGRQQIEVTLLIVPAEGEVLTKQQLDSLSLAYQDEAGEWLELPLGDEAAEWFYRTEHDRDYDYYPSIIDMAVPIMSPVEANGGCIKRLYIHSRAPAGSTLTLRGTVRHLDDTVISTFAHLQPLIAEPSPRYSFPEDYVWRKKIRIGDRLFESAVITNQRFSIEYTLRPKDLDFSNGAFASGDEKKNIHLLRWDESQPLSDRASIVSVAFPNSNGVTSDPSSTSTDAISQMINKQPVSSTQGQMVFILQGEPDVPRSLAHGNPHGPLEIEAYDRHGALHKLTLDFKDAVERIELKVESLTEHSLDVRDITYFRVAGRGLATDAANCVLYSNCRQQTYIDVIIEGKDLLGEIVPIPEDILNQITLVEYDTTDRLTPLFYFVSRTQSPVDRLFIEYPTQSVADDGPPVRATAQVVRFYIKTFINGNKRIGARLVLGGKTYDTCDTKLPAGSGEVSSGRTNTSAMLMPKKQDYHLDTCIYYDYKRIDTSDSRASGVIDIDRYELKMKPNLGHYIVYSPYDTYNFGWDYIGKNKTNWIVILQMKGSTTTTAEKSGIRQQLYTPTSAFCQARIKAAVNWTSGENNKNISAIFTIYDEMGNPHWLWIATQGEMNTLTI